VQAVARRAGVATGSVYRHFPSKAELFTEVFRRASQREIDVMHEVAQAHPERPAAERLAAAAEAFARRALASPVRAYALLAEPVDPAIEQSASSSAAATATCWWRRSSRASRPAKSRRTTPGRWPRAGGGAGGGPGRSAVPTRRTTIQKGPRGLIATVVQFCMDAVPTIRISQPETRSVA